MASDSLSDEDKQFLENCEELLKDRYTEKDEEFMKVFKAEPSMPPILESWWVPTNSGRRNERRFNRSHQPYSRGGYDGYHRARHGDHSRAHDNQGYGQPSRRPRNY